MGLALLAWCRQPLRVALANVLAHHLPGYDVETRRTLRRERNENIEEVLGQVVLRLLTQSAVVRWLVLTCIPTDFVASLFEARMSMPRVLRRVSVAT